MTLKELWLLLSDDAFLFIVERDERKAVISRQIYDGIGKKSDWIVTRITPTIYPMHGPTLEVEIKPV